MANGTVPNPNPDGKPSQLELIPPDQPAPDPFPGLSSDHRHLLDAMQLRAALDDQGRPYVDATVAQLAWTVRHHPGTVRRLRADLERAGWIRNVGAPGRVKVMYLVAVYDPGSYPQPAPYGATLTRAVRSTPTEPVAPPDPPRPRTKRPATAVGRFLPDWRSRTDGRVPLPASPPGRMRPRTGRAGSSPPLLEADGPDGAERAAPW